jgi:hypothetical protein
LPPTTNWKRPFNEWPTTKISRFRTASERISSNRGGKN